MFVCLGGFDDNSPLDCVEKYDPTNNTWTMVANMSCPRGGVGVAALGGKLYAVGGHDGASYLSSVEEYDPGTDRYILSLIILFASYHDFIMGCIVFWGGDVTVGLMDLRPMLWDHHHSCERPFRLWVYQH